MHCFTNVGLSKLYANAMKLWTFSMKWFFLLKIDSSKKNTALLLLNWTLIVFYVNHVKKWTLLT